MNRSSSLRRRRRWPDALEFGVGHVDDGVGQEEVALEFRGLQRLALDEFLHETGRDVDLGVAGL
jgi:hypothetical protein